MQIEKKKKEFQRKRRSDLSNSRESPKLFWQTIKSNNALKSESDNLPSSDDWLEYFTTLYSQPETEANLHDEHILRNVTHENNIDTLEQPISKQEIRMSIQNLNSNRSGGPDGLCTEMFKATIDTIMLYLHSQIYLRTWLISRRLVQKHNLTYS